MKILDACTVTDDGRLALAGQPVDLHRSPSSGGALEEPRFLIMHYTAGPSLEGTIRTFSDPQRRASAHLVIGRNGQIAQCVEFNKIAWHAGISHWRSPLSGLTYNGFNALSIGIELVNAGQLKKIGKKFTAWWGGTISPSEVYADDQGGFWHGYTEAQLKAALDAAVALFARYSSLGEILGHEDIAPERKIDPGAAFPMESFRSAVLGRSA